MKRMERIEVISAVLTASHIINTTKSEENFHEVINLYTRYYAELNRILPKESK